MQRWRIEPADEAFGELGAGVARLIVDVPEASVNTFGRETLEELDQALRELERRAGAGELKGLLIESGKPGTFVAGAELTEFAQISESREQARLAVETGQRLFARIEALPLPVAAVIDGTCVGGGLELALACDLRVGGSTPGAKLGLPEIKLGIVPAWGGCQRLPRLTGLPRAIAMITAGQLIDFQRALRYRILDALTAPGGPARREALRLLGELRAGRFRRKPPRRSWGEWLLTRWPLRWLLFRIARGKVRAASGGHYPAPLAALRCLQAGAGGGQRGFAAEVEAGSELLTSEISRQLVSIFFLQEGAKKALDRIEAEPPELARVGVLGAGVMGAGVAQLAAYRGLQVRLRDPQPEGLQRGLQRIHQLFDGLLARRRIDKTERAAALGRLSATAALTGFGALDLVLEATPERLEIKHAVLAELEGATSPSCVLATNTSSLAVDRIAEGLADPTRLVGLHFFNPVHKMPLVEIVRGPRTAPRAVAAAVALARRLGKTPVVVGDGPGFLVNRVLLPMLDEPARLLADGARPEGVDTALRDFGFPMGPFELLDTVGADVALEVARSFAAAFPDRAQAPAMLEALVADGRLGRKASRGIYLGGRRKDGVDPAALALLAPATGSAGPRAETIVDRIVLRMIAEAQRALDEEIAASPEDVDLAMIFGAGFPPFRGGLLAHADSRGLADIVARLGELEAAHGARFATPASLADAAASGRPLRSRA